MINIEYRIEELRKKVGAGKWTKGVIPTTIKFNMIGSSDKQFDKIFQDLYKENISNYLNEEEIILFKKYIKFADSYRNFQSNIYFF